MPYGFTHSKSLFLISAHERLFFFWGGGLISNVIIFQCVTKCIQYFFQKCNSTLNVYLENVHSNFWKLKFFSFPLIFWQFFPGSYFCFFTPKMDFYTQKTWEKSPNNREIGSNLTYPVLIGFVTGLVVPKVPSVF